MMRSIESASSVFYHSQEEEPGKTGGESHREGPFGTLYNSYLDSATDIGLATTEQDITGTITHSALLHAKRRDFSSFVGSLKLYICVYRCVVSSVQ